jgi:hypothetical protein
MARSSLMARVGASLGPMEETAATAAAASERGTKYLQRKRETGEDEDLVGVSRGELVLRLQLVPNAGGPGAAVGGDESEVR